MLENKFSTLRSEDATITLLLLNSPSADNEQHPTVDAVHNHPFVVFDSSNTSNTSSITDLSSSHTLKQGELSLSQGEKRRFCHCCHVCSSKGIICWTTFYCEECNIGCCENDAARGEKRNCWYEHQCMKGAVTLVAV
eukprot:7922388-Ditylum_brightwellii.AAC.1